ncbi:Calx-beta domain-containing protein [Paracoccus rhizosphaerae]|uniref:Calx-beta domain-containing protein n=1 Tax=Paracoccus rhizosphaerae TaxID=1133347 RepID=A0ABV6CH42_9RHOB
MFEQNLHNLATTIWVLDDDRPGNNRAMLVSNPVVLEEAGGQAQFTVTLSQPFNEVRSFSFQAIGGAAQAGSDFAGRSGIVTFAADQTQATVAVPVDLINSALPETAVNFYLSVASAHGMTVATRMATIADDDGNPAGSLDRRRPRRGKRHDHPHPAPVASSHRFGNDLYFVDNRFDRIIETAGGGFDTVRSTVSQTLANPVDADPGRQRGAGGHRTVNRTASSGTRPAAS